MELSASTVGIVIPVRDEPPTQVIGLIRETLGYMPAAVFVVVDDSSEEHWRAFSAALSAVFGRHTLTLLHRQPHERADRLAGAVFAGFRMLNAMGITLAACMDGDAQHDPAALPHMLRQMAPPRTDVVVASRYVEGGSPGLGLSPLRVAVSRGCHLAARTVFPRRTRGCTDTMAGFFMVRLDRIDLDHTWVERFKVLLQILAQHKLTVSEVGYTFRARQAGESKASVREGWAYIRSLPRLARLAYLTPSQPSVYA